MIEHLKKLSMGLGVILAVLGAAATLATWINASAGGLGLWPQVIGLSLFALVVMGVAYIVGDAIREDMKR